MAAKFEVIASGSQYRWTLTSQGRTLASSPPYARKALAEKAMTSFRLAAISAPVVDTTVPAAKPAVAKAARSTGRAVGKAADVAVKAVKVVEETAAKAVRTAAPRKRTSRSN